MNELQGILHNLQTTTARAVLATLVKVEGSSYRRVGARMLWRPDGAREGSISGGCLEEDLIARCQVVHETGEATLVTYDTTRENDLVWGVGQGCHGIVHVLLEVVAGLPPHWAALRDAWARREPAALAIVFHRSPTLPLGTRVTLTAEAQAGPGNASVELVGVARKSLQQRAHAYVAVAGADVFAEYLPPPWCLLIFGAGDDAFPLARLATGMGWRVAVADPRSAFATRARFPAASDVRVLRPEEVASFPFDAWTLAVVMTHHYRFDVPALQALLPLELRYLGLLGPRQRAERILDDLQREGLSITPEMRQRLHAPVGLDLGGGTPEEVALSIIAEIQTVLTGRDGGALRDRSQPIHA